MKLQHKERVGLMMNKEAAKSCLDREGINNINTNHSFFEKV